jgi:hypothetical protein
MSPRYFAKFTGTDYQNGANWFHFSPGNYKPGSPEEKISKWKITKILKKILRIK